MADKQLTARVRINATQAERQLQRLAKAIDSINRAVGKKTNAYNQVNNALQTSVTKTNRAKDATNQWAVAQGKVNSGLRSSNSVLSGIGSRLKAIAATYLSITGARSVIETSDTITSAENRLNALNGGDAELTQNAMDKMYVSAQKVRMAYSDMISNASKSMTLAGDAFQGNMDNAIRFQEIMAEAYTLGGASAQEQSTSMYQMIQALGSGTLAGDELRSVREGAPLAYKAIEKFAQGVYNTEESLKDLASQGKITSEMVVAAVMDAGEQMDKQFEDTAMTFGQAWDKIKNSAIKTFEPLLQTLNKKLNNFAKRGGFEKIESAFKKIAKAVLIVVEAIEILIRWVVNNWSWIKQILIFGLSLLLAYKTVMVATAIASAVAWMIMNWQITLTVALIGLLIYGVYLWQTATLSTTEFIVYCLAVIGVAAIILGAILGVTWLIWLGVALIVIAAIMMYFAELCGYINVGVQAIVNAWFWCGNLIFGIWNWLCAFFGNVGKWIANVFLGCGSYLVDLFRNTINTIGNFFGALWDTICGIATNISIAFQNAWNGAKQAFWEFILDCLEGFEKLIEPINELLSALDKDEISISSEIKSVKRKIDKSEQKDYVDWNHMTDISTFYDGWAADSWDAGYGTYSYESLGDAWSDGWNTYDVFQDGWADDAYNKGFDWGQGIEDEINSWGSQFQFLDGSWLDDLGKKFGIDFSQLNSNLPSIDDPAFDISGAYNEPSDLLSDILDDTNDISDSMDLTNDDLEYLRKIADMEWRNEFTTAEIKIDMTNNNTVNGDRDLDGIVSYLSDVLREEMTSVAYGVHID